MSKCVLEHQLSLCMIFVYAIMIWTSIPPHSHAEIKVAVLGGGAFGKWLGHESWALLTGLSVLRKGTYGSFFTPSAMRGHTEDAIYEKWVLNRHQVCWCFDLGLPSKKQSLQTQKSFWICGLLQTLLSLRVKVRNSNISECKLSEQWHHYMPCNLWKFRCVLIKE